MITSAEALQQFNDQGILQPGEEGWWRVWGARPAHIAPGDLVLILDDAGEVEPLLVTDLFTSKAAPLRIGLVVDGTRSSIGCLCPVIVMRRGTKNTLA